MGVNQCKLCGKRSPLIASAIGFCADCIRSYPDETLPVIMQAHAETRREFGLPEAPPKAPDGVQCTLCTNECSIPEGGRGFCGLRENQGGRLVHLAGTASRGILHWYRDPLPTNCVADWVCPGHTRYGYHNLAVFYGSCTYNCLFCQNWHYRQMSPQKEKGISAQKLAEVANPRTFCVCYFGGDPASQMPHALAASRLLAEKGVRICWETNGSMQPKLLDQAVELSLRSGGCIKFDIKAFDENLHIALTGVSNKRALENLARAARRIPERPDPPLVVVSTLLVPGYVDVQEVERIASYVASLNPDIPYALLAFYPQFYLWDLPCTSARHARECEEAARAAGLTNVRVGNIHLLSNAY
ncbi:MAG TPA: radical SAM protein [Chloroflexi bacterium]|nr:radical SAM protein [Chloroflexota bacterium]